MLLLNFCRSINVYAFYICSMTSLIFGASAIGLCEFEYLSPCTLDHLKLCRERHKQGTITGVNKLRQHVNGSSPFPPNLNTLKVLSSSELVKSTVHGKSTDDLTLSSLSDESFPTADLSTINLVGSSQLVQSKVHRTTVRVVSTKPIGETEMTLEKSTVLDVLYEDCFEAYTAGNIEDGVYKLAPIGWIGSDFSVLCDMTHDGGGWTVIQRRTDGETDFYRNWTSYKTGFGSFQGDFWLGNDKIFYLTNQKTYTLRIEIVKSDDTPLFEEYSSFRVGNESTKYQLTDLGIATGTAGKGMPSATGCLFSTYDQDNDRCEASNCAESHRGAWWYSPVDYHPSLNTCGSCESKSFCDHYRRGSDICYQVCALSNPNGDYFGGDGQNIFWNYSENDCYHTFFETKIRPSH